jgi:hypothetical protein
MDTLKIEWHRTFDEPGEGFMKLKCDVFFPCTQKKAQKVFTLVRRWCSDEAIAELKQYLNDKEVETLQLTKEYANKYSDAVQKVHDLERMVSTGKYPVGTLLTPDALDQAKADLKNYKKLKAAYLKTAKSLIVNNKRYKKNIAELQKGSD